MSALDEIAERLPRREAEALHAVLRKLREIEDELREQASGSQDGYLLDVANRLRAAVSK